MGKIDYYSREVRARKSPWIETIWIILIAFLFRQGS